MDLNDTQTGVKSSVKYRRRLDRTPDKNFVILQDADKIRLNTLRGTLEEAKARIVRLRDENDEKDFIIEEERKLRQAAEENLQKQLVDLYNNPDVISELRHRLPRARKMYTTNHERAMIMDDYQQASDWLDGVSDVREDLSIRYGYRTDDGGAVRDISKGNRNHVVVDCLSHPLPAPSYGKQTEPHHHVHENTTQLSRSRQFDPSANRNHFPNGDLGQAPDSSVLDAGQTWSSLMSISQMLPPYISPSMYATPFSPASWSSQDSSVYQGLPQVSAHPVSASTNQGLIDQRGEDQISKSQLMRSKQILSTAATQTTPQDIPTQGNSALPDPVTTYNNLSTHEPTLQYSAHSTSLPSLHHLANPGPIQQILVPPRLTPYSSHRYLPANLESDNVSQTSRLLIEIATLKKENEELREKLTKAQYEIESLNSQTKNSDDVSIDRLGSLIEEIRAAERKRDVALKVLVGDVNEDRPPDVEQHDPVKIKCVSKAVQAGGVSDSELSETEDLYGRLPSVSEAMLTDSEGDHVTSDLRKQKYVQLMIGRQREIMKLEMQKVLNERNEARQRVMKLQKKLTSLELSYYKDNRANALLAKLRVTEKERDMAVARLKYLMQDVNDTKLMYRLHKALLSDSPVNQTSVYAESKTSNLDNNPIEKKPVNSVLSKEAEEKAKLETKIVLMEKEKQSQSAQIEKLQQLVERQRQKINTLCAGPMLMEPN